MSSEILGRFPSLKAAQEAVKVLVAAGFSHKEIQLKSKSHFFGLSNVEGLGEGQILLILNAREIEDERKAIAILRKVGASNLSQRAADYHVDRLIADPICREPSSKSEDPVSAKA